MTPRRLTLAFIALAVGVPAAIFAQPVSEDGVSRAPDGTILHRRLPGPTGSVASGADDAPSDNRTRPTDDSAGSTAPVEGTPTFVYDPSGSGTLPRDLSHGGRTVPKPTDSVAPKEGEPIHTAGGLERPPAPLPLPGPGTVEDPSAPSAPIRPPESPDASATTTDSAASASAPPATEPADEDAATSAATSGQEPDATGPPDPGGREEPSGVSGGEGPAAGAEDGDPRDNLGTEARPDRATEREGTLHYNEVFDPSIVPFKRGRALNAVTADANLRLDPGRFDRVEPLGNRLDAGRDVFWGSLLLDGPAGDRIPLPSVAPESRILSYEATPSQEVRFERDVAGNFYATPSADGRFRLVFVMDAPRSYFGRALPSRATLGDVPNALKQRVARTLADEARAVAKAIGVADVGNSSASYAATLDTLVAWFRGFEPGEPPPSLGSVWRDVALGQRGVCRHRSHGFVIVAQSLGIPAHYVFNEAHVFVEVWVPAGLDAPAGWLRIDLGGGAEELQVHNGQGKTLHEGGPDPFHAPSGFEAARTAGHTAGAERVTGLPRDADAMGTSAGGPAGEAEPSVGAAAGEPDGTTAVTRVTPAPDLVPTVTTLEITSSLVFRGEGFEVSGRVRTAGGAAVHDGAVQLVLLVGPGRRPTGLVGTLTLDAEGRFAGDVAIPVAQAPGTYELVAEYLGDLVHSPSTSP